MRRLLALSLVFAPLFSACATGGNDPTGPDGPGPFDDDLDAVLAAACGNGVVGTNEFCDNGIAAGRPGACPTSCDDGNACTSDALTGSADDCDAACEHDAVSTCRGGDGCCPAGCSSGNDSDCSSTCGDGVVQSNESCDGTCPSGCADDNACTIDSSTGSVANCSFQCVHSPLRSCAGGDGCCPPGCNSSNDNDCTATCGNLVIEEGETCDGFCPWFCTDWNACTRDSRVGSSGECNVECIHDPVTTCRSFDGCCPTGCTPNNDRDCSATCGDGVVERGETCDGNCPETCDDDNTCTVDTRSGSASECNVTCSNRRVLTCAGGDGCCPWLCNGNNDSDCDGSCLNFVVEPGETCDWNCPISCDDSDACTVDTREGRFLQCNVECLHEPVATCAGGDGCCPSGCSAGNDSDCSGGPTCGNGEIDPGETCDGNCPTSCNDGDVCTTDVRTGSPTTCDAACANTPIASCTDGDGCCAPGCNSNVDDDCEPVGPVCGNGVVEVGETCDGNCAASCDDANVCTNDTRTGTPAQCNVVCSNAAVTQCIDGDGCCATGCVNASDDDCAPVGPICGNGEVEEGETCDGDCPASCDDGNSCSRDTRTGSAGECNVRCVSAPITQCASGDGCCVTGCTNANDNDCVPVPMCGDGNLDPGEVCDGNCPTTCNDGNACTSDVLTGTASQCNARCSATPITACAGGDSCCPSGCNNGNDNDCAPVCGNGMVEPGETCDGNCPAACNDGNACTTDARTGTPGQCNVQCTTAPITACSGGDGCCAPGCTSANDSDCSPMCGNGTIESGETCDGNCPATCNDGNTCTTDTRTGTPAQCNVRCTTAPITACAGGDGCCPSGCTNANDGDCAPTTPTTCTIEYNITPVFRLTGTPLGLGDGMWTLPTGKIVVQVASSAAGVPTVGGRTELLYMWVPTRFSTTTSGLTIATNVNGFTNTCNGTGNPPPAGQTAPPFTTPPATCAFVPGGATPMATGTFNGTTVTWDQCTRASTYSGNDYTAANTSVSTGPGCAKGYRSVGIITCTDNSLLASCSTGGLVDGQNLENSTFNSPLETVTLTNGYANISIPFAAVPNNQPGASAIQITGVRSGGTCQ